ncbi:MAG: hypothetical protein HFI17_12135 [Lachnospiraceae bacterium]|jgi:flagellar hook-length control protein FliK|nr:hypothetical protein [Lachnospiraceae bacterium]
MEKIVNMQVQASMPASSGIQRRVQNRVQDTKDDFVRLLQQKESAGKPEDAGNARKTEDACNTGKPEEKQTEEAVEEQVEEPAEEPDGKEELPDLVQMELQQSILQQAVVQIAEPAVADQQIMPEAGTERLDTVIPEAVQESVEVSMEVSVLPGQPEAEAVKPEVKAEAVKTVKTDIGAADAKADAVKAEVPEHTAVLPKEEQHEGTVTEQRPWNTQAVSEKKDAGQNQEESFRSELSVQEPDQTVPMQAAEAPVQAAHPQNASQPEFQAGEHTVKSTVEELPQELGKAVVAGKPGDSQVLTVELEPVSLGKLTIRLEYEAGRTMVSVMASNPKTLELLSQKASEIASILKEHTGEETVIYTEQPQKEPGEEAQEQSGRGGQQQERQQHRQEKQPQTDSFMQQLRLGLV